MKKKKQRYKIDTERIRGFAIMPLLLFLFLRTWFDGFTSPSFNHFWSIAFYAGTLMVVILSFRKLDCSLTEGAFVGYLVFLVILSFFSPLKYRAVAPLTELFGLFCLMFLVRKLSTKEQLPFFTWALLLGLAAVVFYGIHQYFWGLESTREYVLQRGDQISASYLARMESNRIFSRFVYPNTFAGYLLMLYPVAFFTAISGNRKQAFVGGALLVLLLLLFAATESMGGWFCFIITSVFMMFYFILPRRWYPAICLALCIAGIVGIWISYHRGFLPKMSSFQDRLDYWHAGLRMFLDRPWFGFGPGNFGVFYPGYKIPGAMEAKYAHNILIQAVCETGISGLILLVAVMVIFSLRNGRTFITPSQTVLPGYFFGLAAFFLHSLVDFDYMDLSLSSIAFAYAGIIELHGGKNIGLRLTKIAGGFIIILTVAALFLETKVWKTERLVDSFYSGTVKTENPLLVLDKAAEVFPEPELFFIKGEILRQAANSTGRDDLISAAAEAYSRAIALNPYSTKYHRALAFLYYRTKQYKEAEREFLKLVALYPSKAQYNWELCYFYKKIGNTDKADAWRKIAELLPFSSEDEKRTVIGYANGTNF